MICHECKTQSHGKCLYPMTCTCQHKAGKWEEIYDVKPTDTTEANADTI